jgi:hypothetical protein
MRIALTAVLAVGICALALKIVVSEYDHGPDRLTDTIVVLLGICARYFVITH